MRAGRERGSRGRQMQAVPSKEELDLQLDQYMAITKSHLDKELDSYMNQAAPEESLGLRTDSPTFSNITTSTVCYE
jgi:hypothetical protein